MEAEESRKVILDRTSPMCWINLALIVTIGIVMVIYVGEVHEDSPELGEELPIRKDGEAKAASSAPRLVYWKTVTAKVTAYEPSYRSCRPFADGKTSTGSNAWKMNGCATDPLAIPNGTILEIPGIGRRVSDDTGGAMRQSWKKGIYHVDVRMTFVWQCRQWGTKTLEVKLYRIRKQ